MLHTIYYFLILIEYTLSFAYLPRTNKIQIFITIDKWMGHKFPRRVFRFFLMTSTRKNVENTAATGAVPKTFTADHPWDVATGNFGRPGDVRPLGSSGRRVELPFGRRFSSKLVIKLLYTI